MNTKPVSTTELSNRTLLAWMFGFVRPVRGVALAACVYLVLWIAVDVLAVRQTAKTVDQIQHLSTSGTQSAESVWAWIRSADPGATALRRSLWVLAGWTALVVTLSFIREVTNARLSMTMVFYIREAVYDKLQRVGFAFHDVYSTGELINRCLSDLQHVRTFVQSAVLMTLEITLIVGAYIVLLSTRSWSVAVLAVLPLPLWTWYILRFGKRIQPAMQAAMEAGDRNVTLINENVGGVHVVKAFGTEALEIRKYNEHADVHLARILSRIRMFANFTPVLRTIGAASHLILFFAAAGLIIYGKLNAGDIVMLGSALGAILGRLQQVSALNDQYQHAIVSARRLREILEAAPTVPESREPTPLPEGNGAITFEGVRFGYRPEHPVLSDVSFSVPGGSVVAIVGPTGAGKTTLVQLLARFYDPQAGRILVDGVDLRSVPLGELRKEIAIVFQESYLFSDAVEANIAYARPGISEGHVEAVSRLAQAHDFVCELERGYDTLLGDRGVTLSGGQRQRLAIARALLADPRILILDDATASVDAETEDLIRRGTRYAMHGRTTVVIAHRVSTVQRADVVIVLEDGRITQMGTHADLVRRDGHYREIARVQLAADAGGNGRDATERSLPARRLLQ